MICTDLERIISEFTVNFFLFFFFLSLKTALIEREPVIQASPTPGELLPPLAMLFSPYYPVLLLLLYSPPGKLLQNTLL